MTLTLDQHWLTQARRVPSPNANARPAGEVSAVVVHGISLPPGEFGGPAIEQLFTNTLPPTAHPYFATIAALRVSAHLLIRAMASWCSSCPSMPAPGTPGVRAGATTLAACARGSTTSPSVSSWRAPTSAPIGRRSTTPWRRYSLP